MKYLIILFTLLFPAFLFAQDTLIEYADLDFVSDFERQQFEALRDKEDYDNFDLCYAINKDTSGLQAAKNKFNQVIHRIKDAKVMKKSEKKQIKKIYALVHEELLAKYDRYSLFPDIFKGGTYNCMSASLLYSMIFEELGIPYEVKEVPQHVFLIAYPNTEAIKVETTDPKGGTMVYNNAFKTAYVKYLTNNKIISQDEYASSSTEELFNEHFHSQKSITFLELLGLQYYNAGVFANEKELYDSAVDYLQKSNWVYPDKKSEYLTFHSALQVFSESEVGTEKHASFLNYISRFDDSHVRAENIVVEFENILQKVLIDKSDTATMRQLFNTVITDMRDSSTVAEITFQYVFRYGIILAEQEEYARAFPLLEKAYMVKPQHIYTEKVMVAAFMEVCDDVESSEELLELFNDFMSKHQIEDEEGELTDQHKVLLLEAAEEQLEKDNIEEAISIIELFEKTYSLEGTKNWELKAIAEDVYGELAGYYFKKRKYDIARKYVEKGLILFPESYDLKRRQKALK
jgi:tetratricopeptide (TPR) repeat protein